MAKYDVNGNEIVVHSLPNASMFVSPEGARAWQHCGIEFVAEDAGSNTSQLNLYVHVFIWKDQRISTSSYCYFSRNGTAYANFILPDTMPLRNWAASGAPNISFSSDGSEIPTGASGAILRDSSTGLLSETYYPIGQVGPGGSVASGTFFTGYSSSGWKWSEGVSGSYTAGSVSVTYNANGGSGSTTGSTRVLAWSGSGFSLTIAENGFAAPGTCAFVGWSTTAQPIYADEATALQHVDYLPNASYTGDSDLTLYAVWRYTNKTVWYNANIPQGVNYTSAEVPSPETKQSTESIDVGSAPTVVGMAPQHTFVRWNTKADGSGTSYAAGATYSAQTSATMYAQWTIDYTKPAFASVTAQRSDSNGDYQVDGEFLHVSGHVTVNSTTVLNNQPVQLTISWTDLTGADSGAAVVVQFSNGNFDWVSGSNVLDPGTTYTVTLSFKDTFIDTYPNFVSPVTMTGLSIGVAFITFSANARGKTAAFGQQALAEYNQQTQPIPIPSNGRLDVAMDMNVTGDTTFSGDVLGLPVDNTTIQYNANNELEVVGGSISSLGYTEITGGEPFSSYTGSTSSWPSGHGYDYSYTPSGQTAQESFGYGWKQRKWADSSSATGGRLEQWVWFWTNYSNDDSTSWWYTYAMPRHMDSSLETFNAKPNFIPNLTGVTPSGLNYRYGFAGVQSINVTNSGASDGLDYTFASTAHVSANDKYLWQVYFDGYWGTTS